MPTADEVIPVVNTAIGFPPVTTAVFIILALAAFFLDLFSHRKDKPISLKSASLWSVFWILISLVFAGFLYQSHSPEMASLFLTGYTLEKVLSVDNLFVFMAIFAWFKIPQNLRHRVLFWGIVGAVVFRMVFVAIGTGLLAFGPWVEVAFAVIVIWTAVMMLKSGGDDADEEEDYTDHFANRVARKMFLTWPHLHGNRFFLTRPEVELELKKPENKGMTVPAKGFYFATPLFLCVCVVEVSDVLFAFDSVPAVIAVSREPLIVYAAMIFAILGLRNMYFVLEALKQYLVHLEKAVIVLLFFIGGKLALNATNHIFNHGYGISPNTSLMIVLAVLAVGIVASVIFPNKKDSDSSIEPA